MHHISQQTHRQKATLVKTNNKNHLSCADKITWEYWAKWREISEIINDFNLSMRPFDITSPYLKFWVPWTFLRLSLRDIASQPKIVTRAYDLDFQWCITIPDFRTCPFFAETTSRQFLIFDSLQLVLASCCHALPVAYQTIQLDPIGTGSEWIMHNSTCVAKSSTWLYFKKVNNKNKML
jgi:hypothetical protein